MLGGIFIYSKSGKSIWTMFLFVLAGLILGSFLGHYLGGIEGFSWLKFGQEFGIKNPFSLELGIIKLTFSFIVNLNISGVAGVALALFLYKRM